jgi:hypothetical protein
MDLTEIDDEGTKIENCSAFEGVGIDSEALEAVYKQKKTGPALLFRLFKR